MWNGDWLQGATRELFWVMELFCLGFFVLATALYMYLSEHADSPLEIHDVFSNKLHVHTADF